MHVPLTNVNMRHGPTYHFCLLSSTSYMLAIVLSLVPALLLNIIIGLHQMTRAS